MFTLNFIFKVLELLLAIIISQFIIINIVGFSLLSILITLIIVFISFYLFNKDKA